jgi:TonB family protein
MDELISFSIKVSVCMILLYCLYILTLRKETHFRFNRIYLLSSILVSFIIPILQIPFYSVKAESGFISILHTVQVGTKAVSITNSGLPYTNYIFVIYLAGLIILFIRFISRFFSLVFLRSQCKIEKKTGFYIAQCKKQIAPFSFFQTIYINEKTIQDEQFEKIILHETAHIRQLHSLDIFFSELICMLLWFNPVSWIINAELKETHEYLADSIVQTPGYAEYFMLLTRNVIGEQPGLANNFNKSLTLKRMNMMKKTRSGRLSMLKVLPVIPLVVLLIIVFSCKNKSDTFKSQISTTTQKIEKHADTASLMPQFPGGQAVMTKFLIENVKYPESAKKMGIQGIIYVGFIVTKSGKLEKIGVRSKEVNLMLAAEAIRVVKLMPKWIPGEKNGVPVDIELTLPINFKLAEK